MTDCVKNEINNKNWERYKAVKAERPVSAGHSVVAGLGTSVVSTLVSQPFELVRARTQARQLARGGALLHTARPAHASLGALAVADLRELRAIVREEGVAGLYRGAATHLVGHVASGAVFFAAQALLQARADAALGPAHTSAPARFMRRVVVSALAGCVQVAATHPIWVVKGRQQLRRRDKHVQKLLRGDGSKGDCCRFLSSGRSSSSCKKNVTSRLCGFFSRIFVVPFSKQDKMGKKMNKKDKNNIYSTLTRWGKKTTMGQLVTLARREGVKGLYAGMGPSLVLTVQAAVQYAAYDELKGAIAAHVRGGGALTAADRVLASLAVRGTAAVLGNPAAVVRTRLMQKGSPYRGVRDCLARVVREEGPATLFRGTSAALWRVLAAAITMPCYDYIASRTRKYFEK